MPGTEVLGMNCSQTFQPGVRARKGEVDRYDAGINQSGDEKLCALTCLHVGALLGANLGANLDTSMPIRPSLLVAAIVAGTLCAEGADEKGFAVAGYLPEWRYLQWTKGEHEWR